MGKIAFPIGKLRKNIEVHGEQSQGQTMDFPPVESN